MKICRNRFQHMLAKMSNNYTKTQFISTIFNIQKIRTTISLYKQYKILIIKL